VNYEKAFPEGGDEEASKGFLYPFGGFCISGGDPMSAEEFKRRLTAILSADVEGYSRLMREDEEATVHTITAYRTAMTHLIEQYRGRVVDSPGDNILAEFTSVVDAVNCGVEIQRELAERNAELPENHRMRFRIGINLGDVLEEGDRIYGDGVNIAARMETLAEAGEICISGTVYDAIENKIGLEDEYMGEQEVKNINKPIRAYRVLSFPGAAAHRVVKAKKAVGKTWRNAIVAIVAVLVVGAAVAVWHFYFRSSVMEPVPEKDMALPLPDKPSIAVLPFANIGNPEQEYIADGITEQIITALARNPELFVIASNSTFTYKGKPVKVQQVSRELGVQYVVEGSVQKSSDRIRITAQLIDATRGEHIWAENYDRDLKDLFALQDEITMKTLRATCGKLLGFGDLSRVKGTTNVEAYLKFLKARPLNSTNERNNRLCQQLLEESIALDPEFATAYASLGVSYCAQAMNGWGQSPAKDLQRAFELAQKAISLDQNLHTPHGTLGWFYLLTGKHDKAITEGKKAVDLAPSSSWANACFGTFLAYADRPEEAILVLKNALRLNPFPDDWELWFMGNAYFAAGRYEDALTYFKKAQERNPDNIWSYFSQAGIYGHLGREEEARAAAKELLRLNPNFSVERYEKTPWHKNREKWNLHINGLRKAGLPDRAPLPLPDKPSIAVLPFANISGDPKEDYLSDGVTEQIITALSKTPRMLVIARNSTFTYKGKPVMVQQISKELGVRYVLEGSVQRSGDRLRITAQLIDAKTGNHLWAERYDRDLKDLFDLQDDITKNVIMALQVKLTLGECARAYAKGTTNLEAYLKLMKGVPHFRRYNKDDNETARQLFEEAIVMDPNYANAYTFLAWTYYHEALFGWTKTPAKSFEKAVVLANKAISLDEQNAFPYMVLAYVYARAGQFEKAVAAQKKALSLDPAHSVVNALSGNALFNTGKFKEAIPLFEKAIHIDPKHPSWYLSSLGFCYFFTGHREETITVLEKWLNRDPSSGDAHAFLGCALIAAGRPEKAVGMLEKALSLNPDHPGFYVGNLAVARLGAGQPDEAIPMLREALDRDPENGDVCLYLSVALTSEGEYEEALSMAKKGVSLKESGLGSTASTAIFYWCLGTPYLMTGEYVEAIGAFKKAVRLWPDYLGAHSYLAAAYSLAGRMEDARAQAEKVLEINPKITLETIAKNGYNDLQKPDKERFINALRKAGLK